MVYLAPTKQIATIYQCSLMRPFLEHRIFSPDNWPAEYIHDFLPLLKRFDYNRGSLMQTSFSPSSTSVDVVPLPPVSECAFLPHEVDELQAMVNSGIDEKLHRRCKAVMLKTGNHDHHVLGAKNSKHSRSSLVLCERVDRKEISLVFLLSVLPDLIRLMVKH